VVLKNLYDKQYIQEVSDNIIQNYKSFDKTGFTNTVFDKKWQNLKLKQRMRHISASMGRYLPLDYQYASKILRKSFLLMDSKKRVQNMIFQDFVELYGLNYFEISMKNLEHFTQNCSSEFAIREFISNYPTKTIKQLKLWTKSKSLHTRRLASEGSRPLLPWASVLHIFKDNPKEVLDILELLKFDKERYVQKSVANSLNDISKNHPNLVIKFAKENIGKTKSLDYIISHGCRTLLKNGDKESLDIFGFKEPKLIDIENFKLSTDVKMGENLRFCFDIISKQKLGLLRVEYAIWFKRKYKSNKKVFKISQAKYESIKVQKTKLYSFKTISTRKYYKGLHKLDIIINGETKASKEFLLS